MVNVAHPTIHGEFLVICNDPTIHDQLLSGRTVLSVTQLHVLSSLLAGEDSNMCAFCLPFILPPLLIQQRSEGWEEGGCGANLAATAVSPISLVNHPLRARAKI